MNEENQLAKWLAGQMAEKELEAFRQSPEYETYNKIAVYSAQLEAPDFDRESMYGHIVKHKKTERKVIPIQRWFFRIAAILVIGFGIVFFAQNLRNISEIAAAGKKSGFVLPDHSEVVLNSGSKAYYKKWNWKNNRSVELDGEAFFKVAKGKTFDVTTKLGKVTVVGTQFNVKARKNRFEIECFEGKVRVHSGNKTTLVAKGEILVVENGITLPATPTASMTPGWMRDEIRIISQPLAEIAAELERNYAVTINRAQIVSEHRFSGYLPAEDLETALKILSNTFHFKYKITAKNKIILIAATFPESPTSK